MRYNYLVVVKIASCYLLVSIVFVEIECEVRIYILFEYKVYSFF